MSVFSVGDQARAFALTSSVNTLKKTLNILLKEQASEEVSDIGKRLRGNTQIIRNIENTVLESKNSQKIAIEAYNEVTLMLDALDFIQKTAASQAILLINEPSGESETLLKERANQSAKDLEAIIEKLNFEVGGRHLFSGAYVDTPPLISAKEMLEILHNVVDGLTDSESIAQAVDAWFDAPSGGFSELAFRLADDKPRTFNSHQGMEISLDIVANSDSIKNTLKGLSISAMISEGLLSGNISEQRKLLRIGGNIAYANNVKMISEQSSLGFILQSINNLQAETSARILSLTATKNEIKSADPFETALAIESTSTRLSIIHSLSNRLSKINLASYLR